MKMNGTSKSLTPTKAAAFTALQKSLSQAIKVYSNVHRGTGAFSLVSTALYEHCRKVILDYLQYQNPGLYKTLGKNACVIFGSSARLTILSALLPVDRFFLVSSLQFGLPLGICALVADPQKLPHGFPPESGGGAIKLVSPGWVVWADNPERFEAGTPAVINAIALACAVQISMHWGEDVFKHEKMAFPSDMKTVFADQLQGAGGMALLNILRQTMLGKDEKVPSAQGWQNYVNMDHAASTPSFEPSWSAFVSALQLPEDAYPEVVEQVKTHCRSFLNAPKSEYELIFTQHTTEAINLASRLIGSGTPTGIQPVVINTLAEHHSNELPWRSLTHQKVLRIEVDGNGQTDLDQLQNILREYNLEQKHPNQRVMLVAVNAASNVLGSINDIQRIAKIAHQYGAAILVDAAQLLSHRKLDMAGSQIDFLALSAHKMYAPFGCGVLAARRSMASQGMELCEKVSRSGEENIAGIAAFGKALELLNRIGMDVIETEETRLAQDLVASLGRVAGIQLYGPHIQKPLKGQNPIPVITFRLRHAPHNLVARELSELSAIGVRHGCFCAHLLVKRLMAIHPVRALLADLGSFILPTLTANLAPGLVRVSLGLDTSPDDLERLVATLNDISTRPRSLINRWLAGNHNGTPFLTGTLFQHEFDELIKQIVGEVFTI